jgi:GLPGLI family protein
MKACALIYLFMSAAFVMVGQEKFVFEGRIEYERKINVHRQVDPAETSDWYKEFVTKSPPFHTSLFTLHFKGNQTMYRPAQELPPFEMAWLLGPAKENVVYNDLSKSVRRSSKAVFEKKYVIADSAQDLKWRITDEKRTIAGMECRKAVTIVFDSVYVVAFYTDEIPVSGGPESFSGLPGMILGLAIPRLHSTWFATRVTLAEPSARELEFAARGQQTDSKKLLNTLNSSFENWGRYYRDKNIWWILL